MTASTCDPSLISARCFRAMLEAMARPGSIQTLFRTPTPPAPMPPGLAALCLTLADLDVPLWLEPSADGACAEWLSFNCGCPLVRDPAEAVLACVMNPASMPPLRAYAQGDAEYPDRSATIFLAVQGLAEGRGARLTGPGIRRERSLAVEGLPGDFWGQWQENSARYPLGVDVFFVSGDRIAGLPRSVRAEVI